MWLLACDFWMKHSIFYYNLCDVWTIIQVLDLFQLKVIRRFENVVFLCFQGHRWWPVDCLLWTGSGSGNWEGMTRVWRSGEENSTRSPSRYQNVLIKLTLIFMSHHRPLTLYICCSGAFQISVLWRVLKSGPSCDGIFLHEELFQDVIIVCGTFLIVVSSHVSVVWAAWHLLHVKWRFCLVLWPPLF